MRQKYSICHIISQIDKKWVFHTLIQWFPKNKLKNAWIFYFFTTFAASKPRWRNGRRARFRCECWETCRFESYSGHKRLSLRQSLFYAQNRTRQLVAPRHTYLQSVVICYANIRVCCAIVPENKFSSHRPSIPTIFDCNNLHTVCSRLLPPFESVTIWRIWGKWPCKTNGWTIVPENKFSSTIVFNHKRLR